MGAEQNPPTPETGDGTDPTPPTETSTEPKQPEDLTGLKSALAKEREARKLAESKVKELSPYEQKVKEAEEANKSEIQKASEALAVEKDARSSAEAKLLRYEVGTTKGVPASLIKFLVGDTKEAVEEAADALLAELGTKETTPGLPGRPKERMVTGQPSNSQLDGMDPMDLIAMGRDQKSN